MARDGIITHAHYLFIHFPSAHITMRFLLPILASSFAYTALAHSAGSNITRCGNYALSSSQKAELDAAVSNRTMVASAATRNVDTYVHVVTSQSKKDDYTKEMVENQMKVMNEAYASMGFSFSTYVVNDYLQDGTLLTILSAGVDFTVQGDWAAATPGSDEETDMKKELRQGSYGDLNLYFLSDLGGGLLGFCYFPTSNPDANMQVLDGCINLAGSMPGGETNGYNEGMTAVHESGHWFGLYHTFEGNGCSGNGDQVGDTPIQSSPTTGCPASKDSCPDSPGMDNIHNYMDYSTDECLTEFTSGQSQRARSLFDSFRAGK
ncbi:Extracellular metalloprotease [Pseudocercospora fuligena]|uniref:Extracellular metalloprotease n=1 Tax=Pseudocercospora fuligena TaxID=685502 RepID=A0A8H6RAS7_9PEZI|nr:Extracellular metalloprotease [Pseudocercospora fuligena]